jgi:hypothetical protein
VHCGAWSLCYVKGQNQNALSIVCLYVDDLLITGSNKTEIERIKSQMNEEFDMTDLGKLNYFLGLEFTETSKGLVIHQKKYITDILKRFNMLNCNPANSPMETNLKLNNDEEGAAVDSTLYKQMVGCLRYACNSRPDICHSVGVVSRFIETKTSSYASSKENSKVLAGYSRLWHSIS